MTQEQLTMFAGVALALILAYVPKVKDWYDPLPSQNKASIMAVLLLLVSVGAFALSCGGIGSLPIACTKQGAFELVQVYILALVANQGTYLIAVRPFKKA